MGNAALGAKHDARDIEASTTDKHATSDNKATIQIPVLGSLIFETCWSGGGCKQYQSDDAVVVVEENSRPPWPIDRQLTVLLMGMTGAGKSSLGNLLAGSAVFSAGDDTASMTNLNSTSQFVSSDGKLVLHDTIGLGDTMLSQENVIASIKQILWAVPTGVDIILLLLPQGRLTDDTIVPVTDLMESLWGKEPISHLYVVFTHATYRCVNNRDAGVAWIKKQVKMNWRFQYLYSMVSNDPDRMLFLDNPEEKEYDAYAKRLRSYSALVTLFDSHSRMHIESWILPKVKNHSDTPSKQTLFWSFKCCRRRGKLSVEERHVKNSNSNRHVEIDNGEMEIVRSQV